MEQRYYQKEIETMPLEDMKALQSERLVAQVKHVYENVPYYREKMDAAHVKPEDIHGVKIYISCRFCPRQTCGISTHTDCSQSR